MRSIRILLLVVLAVALFVPAASADHFQANCPLNLVGGTPPAAPLALSPHGVFRNGSVIYFLRGQTVTTYNITDVGNISIAREDFVNSMSNREAEGGVAYSNGFLYVSGDAGLEIFDLRNTHQGGTAPVLISRTPGLHYRRLAISGNILAALYPAKDMPCYTQGQANCRNSVDLFSITNLANPTKVGSILSTAPYIGFNDIAFLNGYLFTTGYGGTYAFDVNTNPSAPGRVLLNSTIGTFLATNGNSVLAVGQDDLIGVFTYGTAAGRPLLNYFWTFTLPTVFNRSNDLRFHDEAYIDDFKLVTLIDEVDPQTQNPARSIAFDVFDFSVPFIEGFDDRIYENVSFTTPDEVKYAPIAVGPYVYVVGEVSGTQAWGVCDQISGRIELDGVEALRCETPEVHGWVTGKQKITNVELFLDATSLGFATLTNTRTDIVSPSAVRGWSIPADLSNTSRGLHVLRAIATDADGNRRQFNSIDLFFNGPGQNCTTRRRSARH